ncbi:MAG: hypothetical protein ACREJN_07145 [Nitrospiraceae bacterium]
MERRMDYTSLNMLAERVHAGNAKWWTDLTTKEPLKRNVGELLMLAVSELAEAMEGHRKDKMDDHLPEFKMFDVELVDSIIRILDMAGAYGIDLDRIFEAKMKYNATRKDHTHEARMAEGGKKY